MAELDYACNLYRLQCNHDLQINYKIKHKCKTLEIRLTQKKNIM